MSLDDDPVYDREGRVKHDYFLSGSLTTAEKKAGATDMVVGGAGIVFSENNHPFYELLCTSNAAIVEGRGKWYGIFADDSSAWLSEIDFDSAVTVKADTGLSVRWRIPQVTDSAYLGNFSALCTDGDYLYYHSDSEIYAYDLSAGKKVKIYTCEETTTLYGSAASGRTAGGLLRRFSQCGCIYTLGYSGKPARLLYDYLDRGGAGTLYHLRHRRLQSP